MATRNVEMTITYLAWDTSANAGKTGYVGNHTLRWVKDGTSSATTNSAAEVDATNAPGIYKITMTATETDANIGVLCGKSSTANISIVPITLQFERLPDADPAANGGLPTVDANNHVNGVQDTLSVNVTTIEGSDATDQINAACDTALSDYDAPTKAELDSAFTEIKGGTWSSSTDTLEAIRNRGDAAWITASPPTAAAIADAVWDEATSGHTSSGTFGEQVKTDIDAILTDTTEIGSAGAGLTAVPWNSAWDAEVQSECNDALVAIGLDHLVSASVAGSDVVDDSIIAKLVSKESTADWDDFANTTDSLQAIRDRGDTSWTTGGGGGSCPSAADIADAVWDEATSGHTSSGSYGKALSDILTDTAVIGAAGAGLTAVPWNSSWDAEVQSECNDALVALGLDHLISASVAGSDVVDDSIIAKLVSKESTADWDDFANTTDSLQAIRDRGDASWITGGGGSAADIADAVWNEAAGDHTSSGSFGKYVADILTDTAVIGANGAGLSAIPWNSAWDTEVQSEVNDALVAYDPPTKAEMDAMWTTDLTEAYAGDGENGTPSELLYMILCAVSEFAISGTTITGKKVDGSTTAMTWTINDATSPTSRTRAT